MSKKRGVLVWVLFALATILLFVSSLTVWSKRQLLDDDAWAHSSTQLLANDEVRGAIAQKLSDALFQRVDVEAQLRERLPAQRKGTAAVLAAALQNTVVPTAADRLLQRPRVQALWENANKRAHAAVLRVLEGKDLGKNGNISTANGEVTLDLRPAIMRLATRLGLEDKLKANADPNAGQLVIMKSSQLSAAQTAVKILKALSSLLLIAVVALYALAIYLAQGRRRLLLGATGASLVLVGLVIASLRRFLGGAIVDALVKTEANKQPVRVIWSLETTVLRDIAVILVVYGALVLLATALAGSNRVAVAFRRWLAPSFRHHPIVVWVAALFVFLLLLAVGPTAGDRQLLGVAILAATTAIAIEALRRQTLREFPEGPHPAVAKTPGTT
ncbi:MAG TPA: hypothetical protein VEL12_13855 [Candidatus Nitrosopolaris sp.]|jgi:hypothetical protein|nr:hypothetical protein [Candidatus Nitrosopolaris sp.]